MAGTHTTSSSAGLADETTTNTGTSKAGELASKAQDAAGTAASKVKERGSDLQSTVGSKVSDAAEDRRKQVAKSARGIEDSMRDVASSVREEQPAVADALETAIDRVSSVVDYVENTPVSEMTQRATQEARQRPWMAAAGLFGIGFLVARAMRPVEGVIGNHDRYDSPRGTVGTPGYASSPAGYIPTTTGQGSLATPGMQPDTLTTSQSLN